MSRVERTRRGDYRIRLPKEERALLSSLVDDLREVLAVDDPSLRRLRPPAYQDDPQREREYRELVGDQLEGARATALEVVAATVSAERLDEEQLGAWLTVVNDLRLVLGSRLEVTEDLYERRLPEDDPQAPAYGVYAYLGWLQEQLVEQAARGLPG